MVGNVALELENWSLALEKFVRIRYICAFFFLYFCSCIIIFKKKIDGRHVSVFEVFSQVVTSVYYRSVYEQLQTVSSGAVRTLLQERIDEADPFIRFCRRNLERQGEAAFAESLEAASRDLLDLEMTHAGAAHDMLKAKLDRVLADTRKSGPVSSETVEWLGRSITIKGDRLRQSLVTARTTHHRLKQLASSAAVSERMALFDKVLAAYNDALSQLRSESEVVHTDFLFYSTGRKRS